MTTTTQRRLSRIGILAIAAALLVVAAPAATAATDNPIDVPQSHYWAFDDSSTPNTATDSVGSLDGDINGATYTNNAHSGGKALSLDGNDNVSLGTDAFNDSEVGQFALSFQVHLNQTPSAAGNNMYLFDMEGAVKAWAGTDGQYHFQVYDGSSGNQLSGGSVTTGEYINVVVAYDENTETMQLFVDGYQFELTGVTDAVVSGDSRDTKIGSRWDGANGLNGSLDEGRFYEEVPAHYQVGILAGKEGNSPDETTVPDGATVDDFEEGDVLATSSTKWSEWARDTGYLSYVSRDGDQMGQLSAPNDGSFIDIATTRSEDFAPAQSRVVYELNASGGTGQVAFKMNDGTNPGPVVHFDDDTGEITVIENGQEVSTGFSWSPGTQYVIEYKNIDYYNDSYDLYVNGQDLGRYDFDQNIDTMSDYVITNQYDGSSSERGLLIDDLAFGDSIQSTLKSTEVSGTVKDQNGNPCVNCTVVGWGVDYSQISSDSAQSKEEKARELIQKSKNLRPSSFDPELQLTGSDGKLSKTGERYVAVHTTGDWALRGIDPGGGFTPTLGTDPQLGSPLVRAPANEELILTAWDPTKTGLIQDGADGDLSGSTVPESTTLIVEQIGPSNSTIDEPLRLETKPYAEITSVANPTGKTHYAAKAELPTGFYRVKVEGSSFSYVIAVGDTKQMVQAIQSDLNATADKLSNRAQEIRERLNNGKFTRTKVTTNANGEFSFSVGSNVKTVAIQAYKVPPGMAESPKNATLEDIRTYYATTDYNGSVVLPAEAKPVDAPSSNNTVRVREYSAPNYPNLQAFENKTELFNQFLKNLSYSELPSQFQQPAVDVTREQWKTSYETLRSLVEGRPAVEERAQELLGEQEELFIDAEEASTAELRQRATVMQQAFVETPNTVAAGDTSTSTTTDAISARFPFDTDLAPEDVMVTVQYPNGTSKVLNTSSEYVSVESNIGNDAVVINEFPVSSDGPGSVSFSVKVANSDGVATARERVDNPAVSGSPPSLASISLSTLRPGPDETVSMTLDGGEQTTITNVTQATVYAPDGSKLDTSITGAKELEFTTAGQGVHTIQATFETSEGQTATVTERITAGTNPKAMPPGVRISESPLGVYAVTGDGIDTGEVSIENGGSSVTVLAQIEETSDVPSHLHVYTSGLSLPPESDLTVRVVQGADQQSVGKNVIVSTHLAKLDTQTATLYANGEPLPRDGGNSNGEVTTSASGTTVETVTDSNGVLELSANSNPGLLESQVYAFELSTGIDIPVLVITPPAQPATPLWGLTPGAGWMPFDAIGQLGDVLFWWVEPATMMVQPTAPNPGVTA